MKGLSFAKTLICTVLSKGSIFGFLYPLSLTAALRESAFESRLAPLLIAGFFVLGWTLFFLRDREMLKLRSVLFLALVFYLIPCVFIG